MLELLICVLLGVISYWKGAFDFYGSASASIIGIIVAYLAGLNWLVLLLIFALLGYISTIYSIGYKEKIHANQGNHGRRNTKNVLANGLVPTVLAIIWYFYRNEPTYSILFAAGYIGAVASVTADTLSSELGVLSKRDPRLITTFEKVPPGSDGGISPMGEAAGIMGAMIISLAAYFLGILPLPLALASGILGGIAGFHVDSILGALLERKGYMGNASVNLSATVAGSAVGMVAVILL